MARGASGDVNVMTYKLHLVKKQKGRKADQENQVNL